MTFCLFSLQCFDLFASSHAFFPVICTFFAIDKLDSEIQLRGGSNTLQTCPPTQCIHEPSRIASAFNAPKCGRTLPSSSKNDDSGRDCFGYPPADRGAARYLQLGPGLTFRRRFGSALFGAILRIAFTFTTNLVSATIGSSISDTDYDTE